MRRAQNGSSNESNPYLQAGLATGYLCRRTEEELQRIGAATGGAVSARELGEWMGRFFLSQSPANGAGLDGNQPVPEMRAGAPQGYAQLGAPQEIHVRPRDPVQRHGQSLTEKPANWETMTKLQKQRWYYHRAKPEAGERTRGRGRLDARARKRIGDAQRLRWKLAKQRSRAGESVRTVKVGKLKPGQNYSDRSKIMKAYWAGLTDAERKAESLHRANLRAATMGKAKRKPHGNDAPEKMPKGFWQGEIGKLLAKGPKPRTELLAILTKRYPDKRDNLFVTFAMLKKQKRLNETDGIFSLPAASAVEATA